jgi:hypothetical protein
MGSTKTGSMLDFYHYYYPLSQEKTLGMGFKEWFDYITFNNNVTFNELCWHYGMTLLGDPFLKPTGHNLQVAEAEIAKLSNSIRISGNPAVDRITVHFSLSKTSVVRISLFDCLGRLLNTSERTITSGNHNVFVDLRDLTGRPLTHGVYIMKVDMNEKTITEKIIKL